MIPPLVVITDPGEDVDDTYALMLAATSKKYALKAVISANEELTEEGIGLIACYVRKLLDAMGRSDVPVYQGESVGNHPFLCKSSLTSRDIKRQNENYLEAVKGLAETYPVVYILGIATLTSIARLKKEAWFDPARFVIYQMGGNLSEEKPEHNIRSDIEAAREVLSSGLNIRLVTSESTFQDTLKVSEEREVWKLAASSDKLVFRLLIENYNAFRAIYGQKFGYFPHLSDALAFSALEEEFVSFSPRKIEVLESGRCILSEKGSEVQVSSPKIEGEKFMTYMLERLSLLK